MTTKKSIFFVISLLFASFCALSQSVVTIIDKPFEVIETRFDPHDVSFVEGIGLNSLGIKSITASGSTLNSVADHILSSPDGSSSLESAFFKSKDIQHIVLYSHQISASFDIEKSGIEGFSVLYEDNGEAYHALFENKGVAFEKAPEYQLSLKGPLT